jgi:hypothetical protein
MHRQPLSRSLLILAGVLILGAGLPLRAADVEFIPLPVTYPHPYVKGPPMKAPSGPDIEPFPFHPPKLPLVPKRVVNVALSKPVTASTNLIAGQLELVTDGDKESVNDRLLEMRRGLQWVQVDLQESFEIQAIAIWHSFEHLPIHRQVIVQVAEDAQFTKNVRTLFNNDRENKAGLGAGKDMPYVETHYGRVIKGDGHPARFVRWYTNGSDQSALNSRLKIEVYAVPGPKKPKA